MNDHLQNLINDTNMSLAEDGCSYSALELLDCRRDQLDEEIRWAEENGDAWICLKPPSGYETSIPLELAKAFRSGSLGPKRQVGLAPRFSSYR